MKLIIVESPTKANTFNKFLKKNKSEFQVEASYGHIRDLPEKKLSIDVDGDFQPKYEVSPKKKDVVAKIKKLAETADQVILATDADREGEAISYHIAYILGFIKEKWPKANLIKSDKVKRIVFHEITEEALNEALNKPSELNINLVDSQQTRRILDRIVGYKLSPFLWKKLGKRWLSAGRVQTVALRFIVEREKEIKKFASEPFFKIYGFFGNSDEHKAKLISKNNIKFEKSFSLELFDGKYTFTKTTIDKTNVDLIKTDLESDTYKISDITENITKRFPSPPLITSTLQQEGSKLFGFSSKITMRIAQDLYERGLITYHRTDSYNLSQKFLAEAKNFIQTNFGNDYILPEPRFFKAKSKLAQEAHEAIRPTKLVIDPDMGELSPRHKKIYDLIFRKAVSTQMKEAEVKTIKIKILSKKEYLFETSWEEIVFDGFMRLYDTKKVAHKNISIKINDAIDLKKLDIAENMTQAPPRYNEASLIKTLEERGIGRPSTYAPTISTIQDRKYVEKNESRFSPTILGTAVCDYLVSAFPQMFDIDFTANMEDDLDQISEGKKEIVEFLTNFYRPLEKLMEKQKDDKTYINVQELTEEKCPRCGKFLLIRYSKFGKFLACSGYPDCKFTKPFIEKTNKKCPKCGGDIVVKYTKKKKKFFGCSNYPNCDFSSWYLNTIPEKTN